VPAKRRPKPAWLEPAARQRDHPLHKPRFNPKRHKWPTGPIVTLGLSIGLLLGLAFIVFTDPRAAEPAPTLPVLKAFLDERDAKLLARIPPNGFRSCAQARAAGFKEIYNGERAYRPELDADRDGKACEWNGRRWF
jgi:hypothetical protein